MAEIKTCESKVWWRSKTVWASIIMFILWALSVAEGFTEDRLFVLILALATMALGIVLRKLTGQPITLRDLEALAQKAQELQKMQEARSNPASMKSEPWPPPILPPEVK